MKQTKNYETPILQEIGYSSEGVLCLSLGATTEDYNVNEEADW
jgi:hypothetical protein